MSRVHQILFNPSTGVLVRGEASLNHGVLGQTDHSTLSYNRLCLQTKTFSIFRVIRNESLKTDYCINKFINSNFKILYGPANYPHTLWKKQNFLLNDFINKSVHALSSLSTQSFAATTQGQGEFFFSIQYSY